MPAPSLSHLASVLSKPDRSREPPRVALMRPDMLSRIALVAVLTLLFGLAVGILALGHGMRGMVVAVQEQRRAHDHQARYAVPGPEVLLDPAAFGLDLAGRPLAAPVLFAARAKAQAAAARWAELVADIDAVAASRPQDLTAEARLWQAVALHHLGDLRRATAVLHLVEASQLDDAGRVRASDLAGRLWLDVGRGAP